MNEWIFILTFLTATCIVSFHKMRMSDKKLKERSKQRGFISKNKFVNQLEKKGFERKWISRLYDIISDYIPKEFTMSVDDELVEDYKIDDEDLVEIAKDLFIKRNGFEAKELHIGKAEQQGATIRTFGGILSFITLEKYQ